MTDQMPQIKALTEEASTVTECNTAQAAAQVQAPGEGTGPAPELAAGTPPEPAGEDACPTLGRSESELTESLKRAHLLAQYEALIRAGCNPGHAAEQVGVSRSTIYRWQQPGGVQTRRHRSGRRADLELTEAEAQALQWLYLELNKDEKSGSMRSAAKFFALSLLRFQPRRRGG